jgi:hypothetical protein
VKRDIAGSGSEGKGNCTGPVCQARMPTARTKLGDDEKVWFTVIKELEHDGEYFAQ